MGKDIKSSVCMAGEYPVKLLGALVRPGADTFSPLHLSVNLTNQCNLMCAYCSCRDRENAGTALDTELLKGWIWELRQRGLGAVEFTGGGEPTLHPDFIPLVEYVSSLCLPLALVTNGTRLDRIPDDTLSSFAWVRVSWDRNRKGNLPSVTRKKKMGFSWVWQGDDDRDNTHFLQLCNWAIEGKITHLRIVANIFEAEEQSSSLPFGIGSECPRIVVQGRTVWTRGPEQCWVGLISPLMDADGQMYCCCGSQYMGLGKKFHNKFAIGDFNAYMNAVNNQTPFNGTKCTKCFYTQRNQLLSAIKGLKNIEHKEFC